MLIPKVQKDSTTNSYFEELSVKFSQVMQGMQGSDLTELQSRFIKAITTIPVNENVLVTITQSRMDEELAPLSREDLLMSIYTGQCWYNLRNIVDEISYNQALQTVQFQLTKGGMISG